MCKKRCASKDVSILTDASIMTLMESVDANNPDCSDLVNGALRNQALNFLRFAHQNESIQGESGNLWKSGKYIEILLRIVIWGSMHLLFRCCLGRNSVLDCVLSQNDWDLAMYGHNCMVMKQTCERSETSVDMVSNGWIMRLAGCADVMHACGSLTQMPDFGLDGGKGCLVNIRHTGTWAPWATWPWTWQMASERDIQTFPV